METKDIFTEEIPEDIRPPKPDQAEIAQAKEVLINLTKTFSLLKIYPTNNPFVATAKNTLYEKINEFLETPNKVSG